MKINKITIHNLASIADAEIDFTQPPLRNTPLFIICGETGAGKTTVIDAVCLSLYGQTPRFESAVVDRTNKIENPENQSDNMAADDRRNILRKGTAEASAETVFEGDDGKIYLAQWKAVRARKKADGKFQPAKNTLFEQVNGEFIPLTEKQTEFKEKITNLTGYDYNRFVRCVLLAQNQFSKFLLAKTDDKADILQMLTDTSIYETISQRIFERRSIENEKLNRLREKFSTLALLTEEDIAARNQIIADCNKKETEFQKQLTDIQQNINWFMQQAKLQQSVVESENQHNAALEAHRNAEPLRIEAEAIKTAFEKFKTPMENLYRCQNQYKAECEDFCNNYGDSTLRNTPYNQFENYLTKVKNTLADGETKLLLYKNSENKYENIQHISAKLDSVIKINSVITLTQTQVKDLQNKLTAQTAALATAKSNCEKCNAELEVFINNYNAETDKLKGYDLAKLQENLSSVNEQIRIADGAAVVFKNIDVFKTDLAALNDRLNEKNMRRGQLQVSIAQNTDNLKLAQSAFDTAKENLNNLLKISSADLKKARASLRDGDECPLCGSKSHPFCTDGEQVIDNMLLSAKNLAVEKESAKNAIANALVADQKLLDEISPEISRLRNKDIPEKQSQLEKEIARVDRIRIFFKLPENSDVRAEVDRKSSDLANEKSAIEKSIAFYTAQNKNVDSLKEQIDSKKDALQKLTNQANEAEKNIATINAVTIEKINSIEKISLEKSVIINDLQQYFTNGENLDTFAADIKNQLLKEARQYSELKEKISTLHNQISLLDIIKKQVAEIDINNQQINSLIEQENQRDPRFNFSKNLVASYLNLTQEQRDAKIQNLRQLDNKVIETQTNLKTAREKLDAHNNQPGRPAEGVSIQSLEELKAETFKQQSINTAAKTSAENELTENNRKKTDYQKLESEINAQQLVLNDWDFLNSNFGSKTGDRLKRAAQTFTLKILLENANRRLVKILPRYTFESPDGTLDILVRDRDENAVRPVSTVSGGEGFMLSLSLALGLSDMMQTGKGSETLFVDEGFGTLDSSNLQKVISMLEQLHLQGRKVGIISHVPELKERISVKISVEKCAGDNTRSEVKVVG
ncbi:MAG: AAA family ATPase [Bacteroidales bacterium]|nr:AAA family ATPase [Bacteroidales bacterium]